LPLEQAVTAVAERTAEEVPEGQPGEQVGAILGHFHREELAEDEAQDRRHRQRVQQRPADAEHRPPIARTQVHLDQRQPEIAAAPDGKQVVFHGAGGFRHIPLPGEWDHPRPDTYNRAAGKLKASHAAEYSVLSTQYSVLS